MIASLQDRIAVIVGAGGGIGLATARVLYESGARVVLVDRARDKLDAAREHIDDRRSAFFAVDVTDGDAVEALADQVARVVGTPTVLVNSVGWLGPLERMVWQYSSKEWHDVLAVNLDGPVNCVRAFLPGMIRSAPEPCHIVTIASTAGLWTGGRVGAYGAAKHALVGYTETLELEIRTTAPHVGVSLVCPGAVPTGLNAELRRTGKPRTLEGVRERRQAAEVADNIVEAIHRGEFYVFTHTDTEERYRAYLSRIFAAFAEQRR